MEIVDLMTAEMNLLTKTLETIRILETEIIPKTLETKEDPIRIIVKTENRIGDPEIVHHPEMEVEVAHMEVLMVLLVDLLSYTS